MLIYSGSKKAYDISGCGAVGSALDWGSRGRKFKSCHSDHKDSFLAVLFYFAFYFWLSSAKFPLTQKARENRKLLALQHLLQYFLLQNTEKAGHSRTDHDGKLSLPFAHRTT